MSFDTHIGFCYSYNPANRDDVAKLRAIVLPSLAAMRRDRVLNAAFMRHDKGVRDKVRILRIEAALIKRVVEFANVRQYYKLEETDD
jgi:hypothetical protein